MIKQENLTEVGTSSKSSNGKGNKIMQETSKASYVPSTSGKIEKKKRKNPKKSKCFAYGKVGQFKKECKGNLAKKR